MTDQQQKTRIQDGDIRASISVDIGLLAATRHRPYPQYIARWHRDWNERPLYDMMTDKFVVALDRAEAGALIAMLSKALAETAGDIGYDEMDGG